MRYSPDLRSVQLPYRLAVFPSKAATYNTFSSFEKLKKKKKLEDDKNSDLVIIKNQILRQSSLERKTFEDGDVSCSSKSCWSFWGSSTTCPSNGQLRHMESSPGWDEEQGPYLMMEFGGHQEMGTFWAGARFHFILAAIFAD